MTIGCDWLDRKPVVDGCGKCGKCTTGCCLKGVCATEGCDCGCKHQPNQTTNITWESLRGILAKQQYAS